MKSLAIYGAQDIRWEDRPMPEPGEGEVRLRVAFAGICGSDLHYYFHGSNGGFAVREPLTPGHELSGFVDLDPCGILAPGTRVTVHPARYGPAVPGLELHPQLRPGGDYLGSAAQLPHRQGGASEFLIVEHRMIRPLPEGLSLQRASLAEPLAVALHAVGLAGDISGKRVLVIGAGPIGLLTVAATRRAGAAVIGASDLRLEPLERASALGATLTLQAGSGQVGDESYDIAFECSGVAGSLTTAVRSVGRLGTVVQVGILPDEASPINLAPLLAKEATIRGAFRFADEIDDAINCLFEDSRFDTVITHVIPAADAVTAFGIARDPALSAKVLLAF